MKNLLIQLFNRYTVVAVWITPSGVSTQHIKFFGRENAMNAANALRYHGEGHCTVCIIGPCGGLV